MSLRFGPMIPCYRAPSSKKHTSIVLREISSPISMQQAQCSVVHKQSIKPLLPRSKLIRVLHVAMMALFWSWSWRQISGCMPNSPRHVENHHNEPMKRSISCRGEIRVFGEASYSGIEWLHETVLTKLVRIHKSRGQSH